MKITYIFILLFFFLISCEKEIEHGLNVSVTGFGTLYDINGKKALNHAGIDVSVFDDNKHTATDEYGKFTISGLDAGNPYKFKLSKVEYGDCITKEYIFFGNHEAGYIGEQKLFAKPTNKLSNIEVTYDYAYNKYRISLDIDSASSYCLFIFVNDSNTVTNEHFDDYFIKSNPYSLGYSYSNIKTGINTNELEYTNIDKFYIRMYLANYYEYAAKARSDMHTWVEASDIIAVPLE